MAMLAEPRRRKRYNLCPRGKALYEDENRFGTKMLEKMGWTKGNGLGAKQDGEKDFVRIRFKNDAEGLGFEARDDQWTTHEEGFNGLLKLLNGEENEANGKESEPEEEARPMGFGFKAEEPEEPSKKKLKENISGMSLEERSKQSRARVHYKKFTRGKDLSQYSEKDLANIFGKKATDDIDAPAPVVVEEPKEEKIVDPNFAGVQTVSTGLSVSDYFKQKMEAMKNRLKKGGENSSTKVQDDVVVQANGHDERLEEIPTETDVEPSKKKKKKKDKERTVEPPVAEEIKETAPKLKKKKKSKRSSEDETEQTETLCVETQLQNIDESNPSKRKKKKKDKRDENSGDATEGIEEPASKKKKSNEKQESAEDSTEAITHVEESVPKKMKKSKKTEPVDSEVILGDLSKDTESENIDEKGSKKKRKSKKGEDANQTETENTIEIIEESSTKKIKKSKEEEKVETELIEQKEAPPAASDANEKPSKKKRKSNNFEDPVPELQIPELAVAVEAVVNHHKGRKHGNNTNSKCST
ncbi:PIN2/TERF1-interacting telomerase inhibitor 1 isoform X2 [Drosophila biarmipes]|uniref:PIN2/TERF1-interacting telomerase inhibitor 1 isoform X2 n=1 Tax=Drosophila biarmipes TaxID=125945 RepID=UPI0007E6C7B7|nr:PIN2/TERF1-interacting telomerase inhibitor 1 isoform X2 [Drosophila biarmipes]